MDVGGGGYIIGYGFPSQKTAPCIDRAFANRQLFAWIEKSTDQIAEHYHNDLEEHELVALVSFDFNTGITRPTFNNQKFVQAVKKRDVRTMEKIMISMYAPMKGNVNRRNDEISIFKR